jgi:hypothetical protein
VEGDGPISGYFFLLWNRPHFLRDDLYLRVVTAPVYVTAELAREAWPGPNQAVGVGLGGGYGPYSFDEFRDGEYKERESFLAHGAEAAFSYYPRVKLGGVLPLEGQLRLRPQYVRYERGEDTDRRFRLPTDSPIYYGRAGLRLGGVPPKLLPHVALELSLWHEVAYRQVADPFGFADDPQALEHLVRRSWGRAGAVATPVRGHTLQVFLTAGTAEHADVLSTFRMGSALVFRHEFPMVLHGYFVDEIFARRFWLLNGSYRFPIWPGTDRVQLQISADYAQVEYFEGRRLPRSGLRGVGLDATVRLTRRLALVFGYGYGVDAPRGSGFGGHEINMFLEWEFFDSPGKTP